MTHGTIQMFLEAAAGTADRILGEPTQRVAQRGGVMGQEQKMHPWFGAGDQVGEGRARPRGLLPSHEYRFLPAAVDRRQHGRRRQSAGR